MNLSASRRLPHFPLCGGKVNIHNMRKKGYTITVVRANASSIYVSLCDPHRRGHGKELVFSFVYGVFGVSDVAI